MDQIVRIKILTDYLTCKYCFLSYLDFFRILSIFDVFILINPLNWWFQDLELIKLI
jgi:hypothetical protein